MKPILILLVIAETLLAQTATSISFNARQNLRALVAQKQKAPAFAVGTVIDRAWILDEVDPTLDATRNRVALAAARAQTRRSFDKQTGESAAGGGSTSLVAKSSATNVFSAALENGALARDSQGTITTFRSNLLGVYALFNPHRDCSFIDPACDTAGERQLRGLSFNVSIDNGSPKAPQAVVTQPSVANLGIIPSGGRFAGAGARYSVIRRVIPQGAELQTWQTKAKTVAPEAAKLAGLGAALADSFPPVALDAAVFDLVEALQKEFDAADTAGDLQARLERAYAGQVAMFSSRPEAIASKAQIDSYRAQLFVYSEALAKAVSDILYKPALTFEYNHQSPADQASVSNIRLIFDKPFWTGIANESSITTPQATFTFNAAVNFYDSVPAGAKPGRVRDVQAGAQFERQLGPQQWDHRPTLAFAGYYQYMKENAILQFGKDAQTPLVNIPLPKPAVELLNTKGGIGVVQTKLTIPLGATGITVPLAVSWSNRTELIKADAVRAQFGISFDLDNLLSKLPAAK